DDDRDDQNHQTEDASAAGAADQRKAWGTVLTLQMRRPEEQAGPFGHHREHSEGTFGEAKPAEGSGRRVSRQAPQHAKADEEGSDHRAGLESERRDCRSAGAP